ncbi:uncharacterized protein LOC106512085 [Austrofundulus limnaeus]|uniref:Uncharacterized protein LOC106512085 n=1 Tax=Austrofundulus limnaeus TaxID=52670 RepID=A0A2I4AL78_AUSLI|nr:PREDICTED: uncharacterized protein LOC106512085 [Austrofundulus limnaeus]
MFRDLVSELTSCWTKPLSTRVTVPGYGPYSDLEGAEKAGLVNISPMEPSLAAYLAPSQNHGVSGPTTLPSKPCRFSAAQLEKICKAQATTARGLSSISMLQTYQAMALAELGAQVQAESPLLPLLNEIRLTADYILHASRGVALSLVRGMASTVVAQRHLRLTLSDVPDRDRATVSRRYSGKVRAEEEAGRSSALQYPQMRLETQDKHTEAGRTAASGEENGAAWEPRHPVTAAS